MAMHLRDFLYTQTSEHRAQLLVLASRRNILYFYSTVNITQGEIKDMLLETKKNTTFFTQQQQTPPKAQKKKVHRQNFPQ